jgi:hypothetical protein
MTIQLASAYADALYANLADGTAVPSGDRWLALATDALFTEESGDGRQDITSSMGTSSDGDGVNTSSVVFTGLPADTYSHWMLVDDETASAATNFIIRGAFSAPVIVAGGTLTIDVGDLGLNFDAG